VLSNSGFELLGRIASFPVEYAGSSPAVLRKG
jgi:hypothetical protein